jgi:hypothetical protein
MNHFGRRTTLAVLVTGCAGSPAPAPPVPAPPVSVAAPPPLPPPPPKTQEEAHKVVMAAAGCWFGGVWADALGEEGQAKTAGIESRCRSLEKRVWEGAEDKPHYEQLRALEMNAAADVVAAVDQAAKNDSVDAPRRDALVKMTTALADAQRELMEARRAADRVKRDLDRDPEKLNADEVDAVMQLLANTKLEKLLTLDAGDLSKEARALGLLCALDHLEIARGLPKHLKFYAAANEFHVLFGVAVPDVPEDATKKLLPGTWLKFLSETASAAGHPVNDKAQTPRDKDRLAWAGVLMGFSDKLKEEEDGISTTTDLSKVVTVALHRLEAEYGAQQTAQKTVESPGGAKPDGGAPRK